MPHYMPVPKQVVNRQTLYEWVKRLSCWWHSICLLWRHAETLWYVSDDSSAGSVLAERDAVNESFRISQREIHCQSVWKFTCIRIRGFAGRLLMNISVVWSIALYAEMCTCTPLLAIDMTVTIKVRYFITVGLVFCIPRSDVLIRCNYR